MSDFYIAKSKKVHYNKDIQRKEVMKMEPSYKIMESLYKIKVQNMHFSVLIYDKQYSDSTTAAPDLFIHPATLHEHPIFEVFFIRDGSIEFHTETDFQQYRHSIVIIPPHLKHRTVPMTSDTICISFSPFCKDTREFDVEGTLIDTFANQPFVLQLTEEDRFYTSQIIRTHNDEDIHHLLSLLFASLLRRIFSQERTYDSHPEHRVKYITTIENFMVKKCYKKVRLSDLAQALSLSEKQTARLLKRTFGCTLSQLVHQHRMDRAIAMIRYTDLDIREIALALGYEYENYFYTIFRKHYGITPIEYRKTHLYPLPLTESNKNDIIIEEPLKKGDA